MKRILIATAIAAASVAASAQVTDSTKLFGEIGFTHQSLRATDGVDTVKAGPGALAVSLGYKFHPNVAVEGVANLGLLSSDVKLNGAGTGIDGKLDSVLVIYLRPSVKVSENVELFGRLGWARSKVSLSAGGVNVSDSDNDFSYGFGATLDLSKTSYLSGSWTSFYKKDGFKASGLTVSYGVRF